jgi:hypothetical protein
MIVYCKILIIISFIFNTYEEVTMVPERSRTFLIVRIRILVHHKMCFHFFQYGFCIQICKSMAKEANTVLYVAKDPDSCNKV